MTIRLKSSLRKFFGSHLELVDRYAVSVTQQTIRDMFALSQPVLCPSTLKLFTIFTGLLSCVTQRCQTVNYPLAAHDVIDSFG